MGKFNEDGMCVYVCVFMYECARVIVLVCAYV